MDTGEEWRRNGLRLQLVSRWIVPRLDLQVVKAQEDFPTPALQSRLRRLTPYLKDYSDYIVSRRGHLQIVEVKAPVVVPFRNRPFGSWPIHFTLREMQEFTGSPVPVKVLFWDYGLASSLCSLHGRAFYALVDFSDFETVERLAAGARMRLRSPQKARRRWIRPATLRDLIQRSKAEHVKEIRPGRVVRDPTA